jgi:hypothetical protein
LLATTQVLKHLLVALLQLSKLTHQLMQVAGKRNSWAGSAKAGMPGWVLQGMSVLLLITDSPTLWRFHCRLR